MKKLTLSLIVIAGGTLTASDLVRPDHMDIEPRPSTQETILNKVIKNLANNTRTIENLLTHGNAFPPDSMDIEPAIHTEEEANLIAFWREQDKKINILNEKIKTIKNLLADSELRAAQHTTRVKIAGSLGKHIKELATIKQDLGANADQKLLRKLEQTKHLLLEQFKTLVHYLNTASSRLLTSTSLSNEQVVDRLTFLNNLYNALINSEETIYDKQIADMLTNILSNLTIIRRNLT